ncbi:MAG: hypothetical protein GF408_01155 [Candidatus Omnitrophica bacterium]|nr:hypothetical protein [Candidatus Omnitrophota bacterium]
MREHGKNNIRQIKCATAFIALLFAFFFTAAFAEEEDARGDVRFVVTGCWHLGESDPAEWAEAVAKINRFSPDLVIFLGSMVDLVGDGERRTGYSTRRAFEEGIKLSPEEVDERWALFDKITGSLDAPVYDVPSERTIPANNTGITERAFLERNKGRFYSVVFEGFLFIFLDSEFHNRTDLRQRGLIDHEQMDFLEEALVNSGEYENVFVFIHAAAWAPPFRRESMWWRRIHPLLRGKAGHVFGACLHFLDHKNVEGVNYYITGAAPHWPDPDPGKMSFPHFLVVDIAGKKVSVKVVPTGPVDLDEIIRPNKVSRETGFPGGDR